LTGAGERPDLAAFAMATGFTMECGILQRSLRKVRHEGNRQTSTFS
jgi:hypothetical protein